MCNVHYEYFIIILISLYGDCHFILGPFSASASGGDYLPPRVSTSEESSPENPDAKKTKQEIPKKRPATKAKATAAKHKPSKKKKGGCDEDGEEDSPNEHHVPLGSGPPDGDDDDADGGSELDGLDQLLKRDDDETGEKPKKRPSRNTPKSMKKPSTKKKAGLCLHRICDVFCKKNMFFELLVWTWLMTTSLDYCILPAVSGGWVALWVWHQWTCYYTCGKARHSWA